MTPDELLDELQRMLDVGQLREMVDLTVRVLPDVRSQMTSDHALRLHELMHVADIFDDIDERRDTNPRTEAEAQATRTA